MVTHIRLGGYRILSKVGGVSQETIWVPGRRECTVAHSIILMAHLSELRRVVHQGGWLKPAYQLFSLIFEVRSLHTKKNWTESLHT